MSTPPADGRYPELTTAQIRAKDKLLRYFSNPDNPPLNRSALSTQVLGYKREEEIHRLFTPCQIAEIEREGLELRRQKYAGALAKVDAGMLAAAAAGDAQAAKLCYQKFEAWSEKQIREHTGANGKPITHAVVGIDEVAEALIASVHRKADPTALPTIDDSDLEEAGE